MVNLQIKPVNSCLLIAGVALHIRAFLMSCDKRPRRGTLSPDYLATLSLLPVQWQCFAGGRKGRRERGTLSANDFSTCTCRICLKEPIEKKRTKDRRLFLLEGRMAQIFFLSPDKFTLWEIQRGIPCFRGLNLNLYTMKLFFAVRTTKSTKSVISD